MLARSTVRLWHTRVLALVFAGLLASCHHGGPPGPAQPESGRDAWRVLEQIGEVRVRPPAAVHWVPLATTRSLGAGTPVATGAHASLILAHGQSQLIAGPGSAFELPATAAAPLLQQNGTVRYRAAAAPRISVRAGGLTLTAENAVFTLAARMEVTALEVEAGEVRVNTQDSSARRLEAGQRFLLPASTAPPAVVEAKATPGPDIPAGNSSQPVVSPIEPSTVAPGPPAPDEPAAIPATAVALDNAGPGPGATPFARLVRGLLAGVAEAQFSHPRAPTPRGEPGTPDAPDAL